MSVAIHWYDTEKTILVIEFAGKWTWEEFYVRQDEINLVLDDVEYDVDVITRSMDADATNFVPVNSLTHMPIVVRRAHPRVRMAVLVTRSGLWLTMDTVLRRVSRQ